MTIVDRSAAKKFFGIELPENVISIIKDTPFDDWREYTKEDLLEKKIQQQNSSLWFRREYGKVEVKPCFIWLFYNKGFPFMGWWIYIKTLKEDYAVDFHRGPRAYVSIEKIMSLYPCGVFPISENSGIWAEAFSSQYQHTGFNRTKQGLAKAWCLINHNGIVDLARNPGDLKKEVQS